MKVSICVHGHFYQPPRENPWLEEVELQDSAYPYHDWNSRITAECYAPNAASRILDHERRIIDIVNNYSRISFNFGPTLLSWMSRHEPEAYHAVLGADKESRKRFSGHGSALAQCYNHMIMPLAVSRDKRTQVLWGIRDFEFRFRRKPEGMWLPETAVDLETLEIMAECGILFTILAPAQARRIRKTSQADGKDWKEVSGGLIDPRQPYLCRLPSGRTITLFFYDGLVSHDLAFGDMLSSGEQFARRLREAAGSGRSRRLVHAATDGETYGHHHRFGEMALAYCLYLIESAQDEELTVYAEFLEKHPPAWEVEIYENSSWSCFHGVERWRNDCGCNSGGNRQWNQQWRAPLRAALGWLREELERIFEEQSAGLLRGPWQARDAYIEVILDRSDETVERFLETHAAGGLTQEQKTRALKLLEMQRHAMLMYTSCGWFFDEISGIETVQIMQYAARAIQLAREVAGVVLEDTFESLLERAPSNLASFKNGRGVYEQLIKPYVLDPLRVGVHYAVSSLFRNYDRRVRLYSFTATSRDFEVLEAGKQRMAVGRVHVRSRVTGEEDVVSFVVLYFGGHNLLASAREFVADDTFALMKKDFGAAFAKGDTPALLRLMEEHFNHGGYSLWHLFKDEQRVVVDKILTSAVAETMAVYRQVFNRHLSVMHVVDKLRIPPPRAFSSLAEFVLNTDIREALEGGERDLEKLRSAVSRIKRFSLQIDGPKISYVVSSVLNGLLADFARDPSSSDLIAEAVDILETVEGLSLHLNLWKAQNIYFSVGKRELAAVRKAAASGDAGAREWEKSFLRLGEHLKISTD